MKNGRTFAGARLIVIIAAWAGMMFVSITAYADALLTGTVTSSAGEELGGVTVSAKAEKSPITTTVFTDKTGNYYFPPLQNGKYRLWAQALTYQTAKANVELKKITRRNFVLQPMKNQEDWIRQLPGDEFLAALPGDTPEEYRMKTQVRKNCTGCHSAVIRCSTVLMRRAGIRSSIS